ncbi:MAG: NADH-quinone oxidoreductase subunit NuoE [Firmicutes bacterium]|nr:NADH-quinone oxidoreductase subunit NuoE [Bacillota bacterium]
MICEQCLEDREKLDEIILKHKDIPGALIPILHEAQNLYGYLPQEVLHHIAKGLNMPEAEVYGVATFYSQFSLTKKGKYRINVCLGTACYVKGAQDILDKFKLRLMIDVGECTDDGLFSLEACRCIGACGLAPVVTINGDVYGRMTPEKVDEILDKYESLEQAEASEGGEEE